MAEELELGQAIDGLRAQLSAAMERAEGERLQFEVGDVEIEMTVTITKDAHAKGGVKVWVLNAETSGGLSSAATQKLRVSLKPTDSRTGRSPQVADRYENDRPPR